MQTEDIITYSASTGMRVGSASLTSGTWKDTLGSTLTTWPETVTNHLMYVYPHYDDTIYRESKFDTAFKIVEKLMDKEHIKELTVKEFTKLVKEIAETL